MNGSSARFSPFLTPVGGNVVRASNPGKETSPCVLNSLLLLCFLLYMFILFPPCCGPKVGKGGKVDGDKKQQHIFGSSVARPPSGFCLHVCSQLIRKRKEKRPRDHSGEIYVLATFSNLLVGQPRGGFKVYLGASLRWLHSHKQTHKKKNAAWRQRSTAGARLAGQRQRQQQR